MITWPAFIVYSLYQAVAIPLYLRIIYVIIVQSEFARSPFYRLIAVNGILEISQCAIFQLFYQLPMFQPTMGLFPRDPSRLITVPIVAYFSLIYQICFLHSAISFNRLTTILWPLRHRAFWDRWWPAFPAAGAVLSLLFTFHRVASVGQFGAISSVGTNETHCGYTPFPVAYDFYKVNQNVVTAGLGSVNLLACMVFNLLTVSKILERRRRNMRENQPPSQQQQQQQPGYPQQPAGFNSEVRLFIISVWMMAFMGTFIGFELLLAFSSLPGSTGIASPCFLFAQLPWLEALFTLSQPWVLLLANRRVRMATLPFLKKFGQTKTQTIAAMQMPMIMATPRAVKK